MIGLILKSTLWSYGMIMKYISFASLFLRKWNGVVIEMPQINGPTASDINSVAQVTPVNIMYS